MGQPQNLFQFLRKIKFEKKMFLLHSNNCKTNIAGWSSLVARWAHNPKVVGSNPAPATKYKEGFEKSNPLKFLNFDDFLTTCRFGEIDIFPCR